MYEAAAYSQNILKVMVDPATWLIAAIAIFALTRWQVSRRVAVALAVNGVFILLWLVWPAGESARPYAWAAFFYELAATAIWCGLFLSARRMVKGNWE